MLFFFSLEMKVNVVRFLPVESWKLISVNAVKNAAFLWTFPERKQPGQTMFNWKKTPNLKNHIFPQMFPNY